MLDKVRIKHRLIMINLFTTGVAFLLAGAVLTFYEFKTFKESLLHNLTAQARILAGNSTAPLTFNDQKAAAETLGVLKATPNIVCAAIYGKDGKVFADYCRTGPGMAALPPAPRSDGHFFADDHLNIFQSIELDREKIGTIYIRSDLERLHAIMVRQGTIALVTMAIAFGIAVALLSQLQKTITEPIFNLAMLMHAVSRDQNYSLKANISSKDEIGSLAMGFNEMLEQIRRRDMKLHVEIAERRRAEEEVRVMNEGLELKVEERTRQLVKAQEELVNKEKLAMLGLIAGNMGNELRNPLGVMNNAVFFLKNVMSDADDIVKEYLEIIESEIGSSQRIISDLVDYDHIKTPRIKSVPVHKWIKESLEKCAIPENVRLQADLPEISLAARIDPHQMVQVFKNLIANAVQAMPDGGSVRISARKVRGTRYEEEKQVRGTRNEERGKKENLEPRSSNLDPRSSNLEPAFIEISIEDTGTGIAPEHLNKLFQPLFTTKSRGIGLGLAYSKKITEANGGRIEVESRLGEGTTFTVMLPVDGDLSNHNSP